MGDLLTASDSDATYTYTYDNLGRVVTDTEQIAGLTPTIVLTYQYNANSECTQVSEIIGGTAASAGPPTP